MSQQNECTYMLRSAEESDIDLIYQWRNDESVRRWCFDTGIIPYEHHLKWYHNALERDDIEIFILMENELPVGQVRLTYWYDELVISYSIDTNCRGRHLGQRIVEMMEKKLRDEPMFRKDGEYYVAYVKKENVISRRVFEVLGYNEEEQRKWIKYVKALGIREYEVDQ